MTTEKDRTVEHRQIEFTIKLFEIIHFQYPDYWETNMAELKYLDIVCFWHESLLFIEGDTLVAAAMQSYCYFPDYPPTLGQFYHILDELNQQHEMTA